MKRSNLLLQPDPRAACAPAYTRTAPLRLPLHARPVAHAALSAARDGLAASRRHHPFTRVLHWATFVFLIAAAGAICARAGVADRAASRLLLQMHQGCGLVVLALTLLRVGWRACARVGRLHATLPLHQRVAAAIGHHAIHAITLALATLGWLTTNAFGQRLRFFGLPPLPALIARNRDLGDVLQEWHADAAWVLLVLVAGHVAAALWHHYVRRDDVLRSMQPLRKAPAPRKNGDGAT